MERGVHVVGPVPTLVHRGVRADDVVIDEDVAEAELLHAFAVRAHRARVATEFRLRNVTPTRMSTSLWVDYNDTVCARGIPETSWLDER